MIRLSSILLLALVALTPVHNGFAAAHPRTCPTGITKDMTIGYNDDVTCQLDTAGETAFYRFPGVAGEKISITVSSGYNYGPCFSLWDPTSTKVQDSCPWGSYVANGESTLQQAGTYTIRIFDNGYNNTFSYRVYLERMYPAYEARSISYGQTPTDRLDVGEETDQWTFQGTANDQIAVQVTSSYNYGPCFALYRPNGAIVQTVSCPWGAYLARGEFTLPETGSYLIRVFDNGLNNAWDYTLLLQCMGTCTTSHIAKLGIFRSGLWELDVNGNGVFDPGADKSFNWGWSGTIPVHGDWSGDGPQKAGLFLDGLWYLDYNGDGVWDGGVTDKVYGFGMAGVQPVAGDWNGDGKDEIGIYINGFWFLDMNGNGVWDGEPTDKMIIWGWSGVTPVMGDWNGDGRKKVGLFYNGLWYLDYNGDGVWDGGAVDKVYGFGMSGVQAMVGDWNGDGKEEIGIYIGGFWFLDMNGNGVWDGETTDRMTILGWTGTAPLVGDWNGDGKTKVGTFINGYWYLDYNGNGVWDGESADKAYLFGQAGDMPLVGAW